MRLGFALALAVASIVLGFAAARWNAVGPASTDPPEAAPFAAAGNPTIAPALPVAIESATPAMAGEPPVATTGTAPPDPAIEADHQIASHRASASSSAGMIVGIDPETGTLGMPTREQVLELSAQELEMSSRSTEGLREIHLPDGTVGIDLQGRFQEFSVVHVGADGKLHYQCLDDHGVRRPLHTPAAAPAAETE